MIVFGEPQECRAKWMATGKIKRNARVFGKPRSNAVLPLQRSDRLKRRLLDSYEEGIVDNPARFEVLSHETGAQRLVACHQPRERTL